MAKILGFADLHGKTEFLEFCEANDLFDVDLILCAGDLVNFFSRTKNAKTELDKVFEFFKDLPFFFVWGNVDLVQAKALSLDLSKYESLKNSLDLPMYIHNQTLKIDNLRIGGLNFFEKPPTINERVFDTDVFVSHEPPFATDLDKTFYGTHIGSDLLKRRVLQYQPKVWLCGHIHEAKGAIKIGQTQVYNCGSAERYNYVTFNL